MRKNILKKRDSLNKEEKIKMDNILKEKFLNSRQYKEAEKIFIYISYGSEINTKDIILTMLRDNKKVYVPRTEPKTRNMDAVKINSFDNLMKDKYGILEPTIDKECINPNELDLIVVPGLAFDSNKGRIGYGAGYYDRYFEKINKENKSRITKLVLAYDFQVVDKVKMDNNDVRVDLIITTHNFIE